jgi:hypothetical protein
VGEREFALKKKRKECEMFFEMLLERTRGNLFIYVFTAILGGDRTGYWRSFILLQLWFGSALANV